MQSESITKLLPALIQARGQFPALIKDASNPHFKSRYADLAAVLDTCEPALAKHGLAVLQTPVWSDGALVLETKLAHTSGEWIASTYPILANYQEPQRVGAGLTYARRYSYMSIVGIAPEDDDGETASGRGCSTNAYHHNGNGHSRPPAAPPRPTPAPPAPPAPPRPAERQSGSQAAEDGVPRTGRGLWAWAKRHETDGTRMLKWLGDLGRRHGWPSRVVDWSADQVTAAYLQARSDFELCGAGAGDEPDADPDDDSMVHLYANGGANPVNSRFD